MASKLLQYLVLLYLIFAIFQSSYLLYKVDEMTPTLSEDYKSTGGASGHIALCINNPPDILIPCANTTTQGDTYSCQLNVSDPDPNSTFVYNVTQLVPNGTNLTLFNMSSNGSIVFTSNNSDVGEYTFNFTVNDSAICPETDWELFNLTITNANDAPYLSVSIPNISFEDGEVVSAFFLINHFIDPDGDNMTFNVSGLDDAVVVILSSSEVRISSSNCDFDDLVLFTAKDPYNLTAVSNPVRITCSEDNQDEDEGIGISGGGGGGGAGGGRCKPNWECVDHIACQENNTKVKKCVDAGGCDENPEFITVECDYKEELRLICTENWVCGDWKECLFNSTQYRDCLDFNQCGTDIDIPEYVRACNYIPTCNDGVKNGDETGIDCGGTCPPCKSIESPTLIEEEANLLTTFLVLIVIMIILTALTFRYAHKEMYLVLAKLGLHFAGRVPKQILLDDKNRNDILEDIAELEAHLEQYTLLPLTQRYIEIAKSYFFRALNLELDSGKEDLLAKCEERKLNEHLTRVLASFFDKIITLEFAPVPPDGYEIMYLMEELREVVLETSEVPETYEKVVTEYSIPEDLYPLEKMYLHLVNAYAPLEFNDLDVSIEKYTRLLEFYETLSEQDKDAVYEDIGRFYQKIRYRSAWIENM